MVPIGLPILVVNRLPVRTCPSAPSVVGKVRISRRYTLTGIVGSNPTLVRLL